MPLGGNFLGRRGKSSFSSYDETPRRSETKIEKSCERDDLRLAKRNIDLWESGVSEVQCPEWEGSLKVELEEFYAALLRERRVPHDGYWSKATLEVCLAILQSSKERREIVLSHQVTSPY
jgi:phthalate 4,5-cis-dihydrodiol dehydrogenase